MCNILLYFIIFMLWNSWPVPLRGGCADPLFSLNPDPKMKNQLEFGTCAFQMFSFFTILRDATGQAQQVFVLVDSLVNIYIVQSLSAGSELSLRSCSAMFVNICTQGRRKKRKNTPYAVYGWNHFGTTLEPVLVQCKCNRFRFIRKTNESRFNSHLMQKYL